MVNEVVLGAILRQQDELANQVSAPQQSRSHVSTFVLAKRGSLSCCRVRRLCRDIVQDAVRRAQHNAQARELQRVSAEQSNQAASVREVSQRLAELPTDLDVKTALEPVSAKLEQTGRL